MREGLRKPDRQPARGEGQRAPRGTPGASMLAAQRLAGNRAMAQAVARKPKPDPRRARAVKLGAEDAAGAIRGTLPDVFPLLKKRDIDKIQKLYDAQVVNPDVDERAAKAWQDSWFRMGDHTYQDKDKLGEYLKIRKQRIDVADEDKRVRLDPEKLLTGDAFKRELRGNPDEEAFLVALADRIDSEGLWLQLREDRAIGPDAGYWQKPVLTIGKEGPRIPTATGRIDNAALMGTYGIKDWRAHMLATGPAGKALEQHLKRLQGAIRSAKDEHERLDEARRSSNTSVVYYSDKIGGAKFPGPAIWSDVDTMHFLAWRLWGQNKVDEAYGAAAAAAVMAEWASQRVAEEMRKSLGGAGTAVKVLGAAATAGAVADVVLLGTGVGAIVKYAGKKAAGKLATKVAKEVAETEADEIALGYMRQELTSPHWAEVFAQRATTGQGAGNMQRFRPRGAPVAPRRH